MSTVGTTARRGAGLLATVLNIIGIVIVAVIVLYIVLYLLDANFATNYFAQFINDLAGQLNLGLGNLFTPAQPKLSVTLNYGVAAIIWLVITTIVVRLVRRIT